MNLEKRPVTNIQGIRFSKKAEGKEIARGYLYIFRNDLHKRQFGLLEDVFVEESHRGQGLGTEMVKEIIKEAKKNNCYKLIATSRHSRPEVHSFYKKAGFKNYGIEFRYDF